MIITIDGPTASGKSTIARTLATQLNFYYVATGMLYRALAYILTTTYHYSRDDLHHPKLADVHACLQSDRLHYRYDPIKGSILIFDGIDITPHLKTAVIDEYSSIISAHEKVREEMVQLQRTLSNHFDVIVEGRDCGSVVFPNADIKFFVTASLQVRAERWRFDQAAKGNYFSAEQAFQIVKERDFRDETRSASPLIIPDGAVVVDNSYMSKEQTLAYMLDIIKEKQSFDTSGKARHSG